MVFVRKFSEFPPGTLDEAVGLEAGANTRGPTGGGGGGSGAVTKVLPQPVPPVTKGDWVRITPGSGMYTPAQADTQEHAETIGIVIDANASTFTLQQSGYLETSTGAVSGLSDGIIYFLDTATLGAMVPQDALVDGQISRPVFAADSPTSGWVYPYRPIEVSGVPLIGSGGGGGGTNTSIVTVNQTAHGFVPGDVVRVDTGNIAADPVQYALAQADTLANAQAVGVVCLTPPPTANQFVLQFDGYNVGSITVDETATPVLASTVYYLSTTNAGKVTSVNPTSGGISRPIYIPEQATLNLGINAGYILPQRPLDLSGGGGGGGGTTKNYTQAGAFPAFFIGAWLYFDGVLWRKGVATNPTVGEVAGMVIALNVGGDPDVFTLQTHGPVTGLTGYAVPLDTFNTYFITDSVPDSGEMTTVEPTTSTHISKPVFIATAADEGIILNWRGKILSSGSGGLAGSIISSVHVKNNTRTALANTGALNAFVDSGINITITPTSATSTILLMASVAVAGSNTAVGLRFLRSPATVIDVGAGGTMGNFGGGAPGAPGTAFVYNAAMQATDSPATTSAVTYKLQYSNGGSSSFINGESGNNLNCITSITAFEIAG